MAALIKKKKNLLFFFFFLNPYKKVKLHSKRAYSNKKKKKKKEISNANEKRGNEEKGEWKVIRDSILKFRLYGVNRFCLLLKYREK